MNTKKIKQSNPSNCCFNGPKYIYILRIHEKYQDNIHGNTGTELIEQVQIKIKDKSLMSVL